MSSVAVSVVRQSLYGLVLANETSGATTVNAYDAFGRIAATSRSVGGAAFLPLQSFDYAPWGDLVATHTYTNHEPRATSHESYAYDMLGNRVATTDALGNTIFKSYDAVGNVIAEDGATYPVRYTYDSVNRRVIYSDDEVVSLAYDEFGYEIVASNEVSSVVSLRSEQGDCTNEMVVVSGEPRPSAVSANASAVSLAATNETFTILRAFDEHRRLTEVDGTAYTYNSDGLLASVSNDIAFVEYAYTTDLLDAGYTLTLSNGVVFTRSLVRDDSRRLLVTGIASVANGVGVGSLAYTYDALGRPTIRNADTFGYNERGEVVFSRRDAGNAEENYEYDFIGNLLEASQCAPMTNAYVANNLNQYSSIREISAPSAPLREITHDADGNMTQCGDWTYTYDAANRLKTASSNGVLLVTNFYDAKSRRVKKVTHEATTTFFYDGWNLIEERIAYTNGTSSTIHYYWGKDLSGTLQGAGGIGGLLCLTVDGTPYIPAYDNNGNITRYLDASGNAAAQYTYDAFGNSLSNSGPLADFFRHRFSTKYFNVETVLYYYGYRFYSPSLMRWINRDPIEEDGGLNLYGFCGNAAVDSFDKLGLVPTGMRQCSKNGAGISFVFDGNTLSGGGFSAIAASGRPQKASTQSTIIKDKLGRISGVRATYNYEFDYGKKRQRIKDVGPTPEGTYYILVNEKRTKWNSVRTHILRHSGWGDYGWSLHPEPNTETYGRGGFFIHGGSEWGSAGCIDLTIGDGELSKFLDGLCNCYIPVTVKYAVKRNTISETYTNWIPE